MFARHVLLSAAALLASGEPRAAPVQDAFARECRVRRAASDPAAASAWLASAFEAARGEPSADGIADALDALDALHRAFEARPEQDPTPWIARVVPLASAVHPNLRAGAWRVLANAAPAALGIPAPVEVPGTATWEERVERARALARGASAREGPEAPGGTAGVFGAWLAAACADPDARVADNALAEALQSADRDDRALALAWTSSFERARARADDSAMELVQQLELAPRGLGLARGVLELVRGRVGADPDGWRALEVLCLACVARQGGALEAAELDRLADEWHATSRRQPGARSLLARAARSLGSAIGTRLAQRATVRGLGEDALHDCLEGAVEALDEGPLLRLVAADAFARPELARALFESLRGRVDAWDADALAPWLASDLPAEQRARIVLIVAETFRQNGDAGSARILVEALEDRDPDVAAEAFQGLAGAPDPAPWMERLHAAWARRPARWREARLGDLSRELAWKPFRADLLELAAQSRTASARAAELLAPFRGDREVAAALAEWLEQDLARVRESAPRPGEAELPPGVLASALSLVRALAIVAEGDAVPSLERALEVSRGRSVELGKTCIAQLGRTEPGRRGLAAWLSPQVPSRLRAEAALALAPHSSRAAALHVLLADYGRYDETLRTRALRAFGGAEDAASAERLFEVARAAESGAAEVLTAIECAGQRAARDPLLGERLFAWLAETALDPEVRTLAIGALARIGTPAVHARLLQRLRDVGGAESAALPSGSDGRAKQEVAFERETLIAVLAATGSAEVVAAFDDRVPFEVPLLRAPSDFRARARGEPLAEAEFTARAELSLVAAFADAGRLRAALDLVPGWPGLDARFLLECAARASGGDGERLALAAQIALAGESAVDDSPRVRFEARRLALEAARERGDAHAFAARGSRLAADVRTGAVPPWIFSRAYGDFDPRRGVDGLARLDCEVHLARARVALAAGRGEDARRELELARSSRGASTAAAEAVELFERERSAAGR